MQVYWDNHLVNWGEHGNSFVELKNGNGIKDSVLNGDTRLSLKVLDRVEKFLKTANQDSKEIYVFSLKT